MKSTRNGTKVSQETVAYLGEVTFDQIPYLKAAYAKNKPLLVYPEESL
ncbi:2-C-methyl-D-erythritol 4-phosphate cytidylyltransferase [Erysipelatoclostridium sp. DFI.2.3]|nr:MULTISPECIES: 2-C-methyl-D-erythritol 4-phosphate cytidylyltransferase [Thomasclavelia]MBS5685632.1 2-C-methyl-D-erythritol 4-phosphate cytidylyltransferase [[Clostridium] innocuum]MCR0178654.1 2-C-methyl-D-erythritol 4-phosphate cytidylyltransferase [[Clostridium] innocuum]MCR0189681.1 2-C-methyl-D-erythritol 4-phosphate cytidylyltransferase [[Clostridium] innocuum]MCR0500281.1 2-C-methyl-D-erythritol 4-phosphate cytidylyltransferase [[Clostridium] innocuum]